MCTQATLRRGSLPLHRSLREGCRAARHPAVLRAFLDPNPTLFTAAQQRQEPPARDLMARCPATTPQRTRCPSSASLG